MFLRAIVQPILGKASESLFYVGRLADMLITTGRQCDQPPPKIDKGTNTEDALVWCAKTGSPSELLNHPVLWFAMYLGLVKPIPRYSEFLPRRRRRLRLMKHQPLRTLGWGLGEVKLMVGGRGTDVDNDARPRRRLIRLSFHVRGTSCKYIVVTCI